MKIITCNCQGAKKSTFAMHCIGLCHAYHLHVMMLMETRLVNATANTIIPTLGFRDSFRVLSVGFMGSIWVLWNSDQVRVDIIAYSTQAVHAIIRFLNDHE